MNTDYQNKLVQAPWIGRTIATAILGMVETIINAPTNITNKFKEKSNAR